MDERIVAIAVRQHGVVGRRQLFAAGLTRHQVDEAVRLGRIRRVSRGTYIVAGAPLTVLAEMMAAALRCGPNARVVGEPLLSIVGVHTARPDGDFEVLTRPGRQVTGVDWRWRQAREDLARHRATIASIPSVTPARMLLEWAVRCDDRQLARLVDGFRWTGRLASVVSLARAMPRHTGARRVLASGLVDAGAPESGTERVFVAALDGLGAETQVWLTPAIRVDVLFRRQGLVVERDPDATHGGPVARSARVARDADIRALGLAVEHVTDDDMQDLAALRRRITVVLAALGDRPHVLR